MMQLQLQTADKKAWQQQPRFQSEVVWYRPRGAQKPVVSAGYEGFQEDELVDLQEDPPARLHRYNDVRVGYPARENRSFLRQQRRCQQWLQSKRVGLMAWCWMPPHVGHSGNFYPHAKSKEAAMLVMYQTHERKILVLYRIDPEFPENYVALGGEKNVLLAVDFNIRPKRNPPERYPPCLDSKQRTVYRAALLLDQAIAQAAAGKISDCDRFTFPPVYLSFPIHHRRVEMPWRVDSAQRALMRCFATNAPTLRPFISPGCTVLTAPVSACGWCGMMLGYDEGVNTQQLRAVAVSTPAARREMELEFPAWLRCPTYSVGTYLPPGTTIIDLPRFDFASMTEMRSRFGPTALEWVFKILLHSGSKQLNISDESCDSRWLCTPHHLDPYPLNVQRRHIVDLSDFMEGRRPLVSVCRQPHSPVDLWFKDDDYLWEAYLWADQPERIANIPVPAFVGTY